MPGFPKLGHVEVRSFICSSSEVGLALSQPLLAWIRNQTPASPRTACPRIKRTVLFLKGQIRVIQKYKIKSTQNKPKGVDLINSIVPVLHKKGGPPCILKAGPPSKPSPYFFSSPSFQEGSLPPPLHVSPGERCPLGALLMHKGQLQPRGCWDFPAGSFLMLKGAGGFFPQEAVGSHPSLPFPSASKSHVTSNFKP